MKTTKIVLIMLFALPLVITQQKKSYNPKISANDIKEHIFYLASDEMEGRMTGSEGEKAAGEYIKQQFEKYGLLPLFDGSYFQEFEFTETVKLTDNNRLALQITKDNYELTLNNNFAVAPFTGNGKAEANLVFVGYGISSLKLMYDDYNDIDVTGKIVVAMRNHPEHDSANSSFENFASLRAKATVARDKGAAGIIFVNGHLPAIQGDDLVEFNYGRGNTLKDFPAVHVKREFIDKLFRANKLNFAEHQKKIDAAKFPASFEFTHGTAKMETELEEVKGIGRNVGGYLPGNSKKNDYLVYGAHYDHVGWGKFGSMTRDGEPAIHNGADDNASGTVGLLELAEKFSAEKDKIKHNMVFLAFSGEELGLLGSAYFTDNSPFEMTSINSMLNMDMIGRLNEERSLTVVGAASSPMFKELLNEKNTYNFNVSTDDGGFGGGSDHHSFYLKKVPVMFFFTGIHSDYHRPSDDADKINVTEEANIVNYVYSVASALDNLNIKPEYAHIERKEQPRSYSSKVYVGTVPEFGYNGDGFKLSGVSEGSPAQKGGLLGGDIMIKFGAKKVESIYDFMYAMGEYSPGDEVDVVVLRDGKEVTVKLKLESK